MLWLIAAPVFAQDKAAIDHMFDQFDHEAWHDPYFLQRDDEAKREREARAKKLREANQEQDDKKGKPNNAGYQPEDFGPEDFRDLDVGKDIFEKFYMDLKNFDHKDVVQVDDEPFARRYMDQSEGDHRRDDKGELLSPIRASLGQKPNIIQDWPGDWVPDKLDPIDNGGFAVSPDNGSPVPYRLNGHVDLQRVRPWDINN